MTAWPCGRETEEEEEEDKEEVYTEEVEGGEGIRKRGRP